MPNLEKKEHYYVNPCLSQLANKLQFQKMVEWKAFLIKPKQQCHSSQWGEWVYSAKSWKERRLLCKSMFVPIDKRTLIQKNGGNKSFLKETKTLTPFIEMWGISLWRLILKRKYITIWICVCPSWQTNFNSKKGQNEKLFLRNQSINVIHINKENEFVVPNLKKKGDYYVNPCLSHLANEL